MDKIILKASRRDVIGKKVKVLRREGKLPAVIYGYNMEPLPILLDLRETTKQLREVSRATVLTVDVSGDKHTVLVRERQRGPRRARRRDRTAVPDRRRRSRSAPPSPG